MKQPSGRRVPAEALRVPEDAGQVLLPLARAAIAARFGHSLRRPSARWLAEPGASFVTLTIAGRLRGCIGSLTAHRSLGDDIEANAVAAAFRDARFPPLAASELEAIRIEVSVLTEPEPLRAASRGEALAQLVPGTDGVIVNSGGRRATFLPQVWQQLPDPEEFLRALLRKAGLSPNHWDADTTLERYGVASWIEPEEQTRTSITNRSR